MMKIKIVQVIITENADTRLVIQMKMESDSHRVLKESAGCLLLHGVIMKKHTSTLKLTRNHSYLKCTSGLMTQRNATGVIDTD